MRKFKYIAVAGALAALAVPSAAMADTPDGEFAFKTSTTYDQTNQVAHDLAQITQNGQFVGGNKHADPMWDQTTDPGSRAAGAGSAPPGWRGQPRPLDRTTWARAHASNSHEPRRPGGSVVLAADPQRRHIT